MDTCKAYLTYGNDEITQEVSTYIENLLFTVNEGEQLLIKRYLIELDKRQSKALNIAVNTLESSFNLLKCSGYVAWKKNINHYQKS